MLPGLFTRTKLAHVGWQFVGCHECNLQIAKTNLIGIDKGVWLIDIFTIDPRSVCGIEIFNDKVAVVEHNARMFARDAVGIEYQIVAWQAAEDRVLRKPHPGGLVGVLND